MARIVQVAKVEETRLWLALEKRAAPDEKALCANIVSLCEEAIDRMRLMCTYAPQYTLHDERHLLRTTELMAEVLGSAIERLSVVELALLILSAFFHDQGMVPSREEITSLECNPDFKLFRDNWLVEHPNYGETEAQLVSLHLTDERRRAIASQLAGLDSAILIDFLRSTHGPRSEAIVRSAYANDKRLDIQGVNLTSILGKLCCSHTLPVEDISPLNGFSFDEQIGRFSVNLPFLAVVLRLADILDFDRDRTPEVLLKNIHFTSQVSLGEWEKHRSVEGWSIAPDRILFTIRCSHPAYEAAIREHMDWIDSELMAGQEICRIQPRNVGPGYELRLPSHVDRSRIGPLDNAYRAHKLEFSLSRNEIVRLLMTDKLYGNEHLCVRELLQNSLDALRYRKAVFGDADIVWGEGRIDFRHYVNSDGFEVLECKDNGVGMDDSVIQNYLVKVGRSYYRSPAFERERNRLRASGNDFDPCSRFGIGFMSCFMLGDRITITTRKDYGPGKNWGPPLILEIHGLSSLLVVRQGSDDQPIGTTISIVCRQKPSFLDSWTDRIQLCSVLKGYALATEFPVHGQCQVQEIREVVEIPKVPEKIPTLLERAGLSNYVSLEQDLSVISPDLSGFVRESYLVDEEGMPCLVNREAEWRGKEDGARKKWELFEPHEDRILKNESSFYEGVPVCVDGILVAGPPGRPSYGKEIRMRLGMRNSHIYSKAPALIDVRGDSKPELTAARTPPEKMGGFSNWPPRWERLADAFNEGKGLLGGQLAEYLQRGLSPEIFWKLCVVHDISVRWIPHDTLWGGLSVPLTRAGKETWWQLVRDLGELTFSSSNNVGGALLQDSEGNQISLGTNLETWERTGEEHPSLLADMTNLTLLMCALDVRNEKVILVPRPPEDGRASLARYTTREGYGVGAFCVDFVGAAKEAVAVEVPSRVANRKHPLVVVASGARYAAQPNDLQRFAKSFITCIAETVSSLPQTPNLEKPSYWQKRVGYLYYDVRWDQYDSSLRPPYKLWTSGAGWVFFDETDFARWRDASARLD